MQRIGLVTLENPGADKKEQTVRYFLTVGKVNFFMPLFAMCKKRFFYFRVKSMVKTDEIRIAIIAIVIEDKSKSNTVNAILHDYSDLFVGRMGIPFKEKKISVITLIAQGTNDNISALTGKLGRVEGITVNSMLTKKSQK